MKDEKKSKIITDAITDYQNIMESAQEVAKQKLAEEYSEKFNSLLNEEIFKNKNKAKESDSIDNAQESDDSDDTNNNNNSDMNNNVKKQETVKVNHKIGDTAPFNQKPKAVNEVDETDIPVDETVTIQDTVGDGDPFNKKNKKVDETVTIQDTVGKPDPFTVKGKKSPKIEESFDLSEFNIDDEPESDDEEQPDDTFSFDDIEGEISGIEETIQGMNGLPRPGNFGKPTKQGGDPYAQLAAMRDQLNEILGGIGDETTPEPRYDTCPPQNEQPMEENDEPITDNDIDNYFNQQDEPVEESLGVSHATNKISTAHIPGADYASSPAAVERRRPSFTNENKKLNGLMEENKKLTKKLNETKKEKEANVKIMEGFRDTLNKYRNQLKEMAIFNTNLANVNSILVNESLNLTQQDKVRVINEFKKVNTIDESREKYNTLVREITETKKSITESVEKLVSTSIQPSSSELVNEAIETTVYSKDKNIQRMKRLIEYNENK